MSSWLYTLLLREKCDSEVYLRAECEEGLSPNLDCDINKKVLYNYMDKYIVCWLVFKIEIHLLSFLVSPKKTVNKSIAYLATDGILLLKKYNAWSPVCQVY